MLPSQRKVQSELRKYVRVDSLYGSMLFLIDMSMYIALIYGVLFLPELWMKIIASVVAGIKIANLATLAHDAAHNSLTKSRLLNKLIAIASFLPGLINYQLWLYDHHRLHHARTNENFPDSYTPYSKGGYDALSPFRRWKEKLYRTPSLLYFGLYYILERWSKVKLYPQSHMPQDIHAPAWGHFALISVYFIGLMGLLACAPLYSGTSAIEAIMLGFVIPFYIFQSLYAFTVYVQHTHPRIAWFEKKPDRSSIGRQEFISVQLVFPEWLSVLMHHVYEHGAHHVCPAIPCYQLKPAQARLNELIGERAVSQHFSFEWLFETMRTCKLYDYDNHCWLDFDGSPTSGPTLLTEEIRYIEAA